MIIWNSYLCTDIAYFYFDAKLTELVRHSIDHSSDILSMFGEGGNRWYTDRLFQVVDKMVLMIVDVPETQKITRIGYFEK